MPAPMNRNLLAMSRTALYGLKRQYGGRIDVYKLVSSETDARTGVRTIDKQVFTIRKAIVMPVKIIRLQEQSISLISANKSLVMGGTIDTGTRDFIIDRRDCPDLPELTADDWVVYDGSKYQISTVYEYEPQAGWVINAKKLVGERPEQVIAVQADHLLLFDQSTETETA